MNRLDIANIANNASFEINGILNRRSTGLQCCHALSSEFDIHKLNKDAAMHIGICMMKTKYTSLKEIRAALENIEENSAKTNAMLRDFCKCLSKIK